MLTPKEILEQSRSAIGLWGETWEKHSKINGAIYKRMKTKHKDLLFTGAGRTLLCISNSPSFEKKIDIIEKYKDKSGLDIACVDKSMCRLLDRGIIPKFVHIADAGISYQKYCAPWIDQTKNIILVANINANIEWTQNWKGKIYFYVNKDNIESEKIYCEISGCYELIPAASNVGNSLVVFSTQILGYDRYLLLGFDFGWYNKDNYYAFEDSDKRYWMKHIELIDYKGDIINSSQNLLFSMRWLSDYFYANHQQFGYLNVFNCGEGLLSSIQHINLDKALDICKIRKLEQHEKNIIFNSKLEEQKFNGLNKNLLNQFLSTKKITEIIVKYLPKEVEAWLS